MVSGRPSRVDGPGVEEDLGRVSNRFGGHKEIRVDSLLDADVERGAAAANESRLCEGDFFLVTNPDLDVPKRRPSDRAHRLRSAEICPDEVQRVH